MKSRAMEVAVPVQQRRPRSGYLPIVDTACCCCRLETCCTIMGILAVIGSVSYIFMRLVEIIGTEAGYNMERECHHKVRELCEIESSTRVQWGASKTTDVGIAISMILEVLVLGFAIRFLIGIYRMEPKLMKEFVALLKFHVVFNVAMCVALAIVMGNFFVLIVLLPLSTCLPLYMVVCANSLYLKLKAEQPVEATEMPHMYVVVNTPAQGPPPPGYPSMAPALEQQVVPVAAYSDLPPPYPYPATKFDGSGPTMV